MSKKHFRTGVTSWHSVSRVFFFFLLEWAPDFEDWRMILEPHVAAGETWLSAPWCVAEFYFYRRVMEALSFYQKDAGIALPSFFDPFLTSKRKGLESALGSVEELAPRVLDAIDAAGKEDSGTSIASSLRLFILISLWGNRMDLSLWPAGSQGNVADSFSQVLGQGEVNLLADDFGSLFDLTLEAKAAGGKRFDIIVDNAGFEFNH